MGQIRYCSAKAIGGYPILVAKKLAIRKAVLIIILKKLSNVVIENDSYTAIRAINLH